MKNWECKSCGIDNTSEGTYRMQCIRCNSLEIGIPKYIDDKELEIHMPEYLRVKAYGINGDSE